MYLKWKKLANKEWLKRQLENYGYSQGVIAHKIGCHQQDVSYWAKKFNINSRLRPPRSTHKRITKSDARWLAGVIDGEGCISSGHSNREPFIWRPFVGVSNTNLPFLKEIKRIVGFGHIYTRIHNGKKWRDSYEWRISRYSEMRWLLNKVKPFLIIKKKQALVLLSAPLWKEKNKTARYNLWRELGKLNKRGK
jgi:hypothetical protein